MHGLILAGGTGSRLWPITRGISKQLLPIYDKPLIYYPIATLMSAQIREITIITTPQDSIQFQNLLGDGSQLGVRFNFLVQNKPEGIAQAFIIAAQNIANKKCALVLGDNLFHGSGLGSNLQSFRDVKGAQIFAYRVADPERYGVVEFDNLNNVISLEEKPSKPKSNYAIPGLYFYDESILEVARDIKPSTRGELEISSVNQAYLDAGKLKVSILPRGTAWLDTGTPAALNDASSYVRTLEERQGTKIACIEEISFRNHWISSDELFNIAKEYVGGDYGSYLRMIAQDS